MKRIFIFIFVYLFYHQSGFSQVELKNTNLGWIIDASDLGGRSLLKRYDPDITGSPFINDNWVRAKLTLSKGKVIGPIPIKMNIESNELYYQDSTGKEMVVVEGLIRKIDCIDFYSKDSIRYVFKSGYPSIDKQNENYYYQVLTEGNIQLLEKRSKSISNEKDALSGQISKEFVEDKVVLYVYASGTIQPFRSTKNFTFSLFEKNKELPMNKFAEAEKLNFKKTVDLIRLFNYYNSLP